MILPGRVFKELAILPGLGLNSGVLLERCLSNASRALLALVLGCEPSSKSGVRRLAGSRGAE
jgi:hypothetical protein